MYIYTYTHAHLCIHKCIHIHTHFNLHVPTQSRTLKTAGIFPGRKNHCTHTQMQTQTQNSTRHTQTQTFKICDILDLHSMAPGKGQTFRL